MNIGYLRVEITGEHGDDYIVALVERDGARVSHIVYYVPKSSFITAQEAACSVRTSQQPLSGPSSA